MRIAINATNISGGGGLNHLLRFFENLENHIEETDVFILWGKGRVLKKVADKPFIIKKTNRFINSNTLIRSIWVKIWLKSFLKKDKCEVLYNPGGNDLSGFKPLITMSRNMLPFELKLLIKEFELLLFIKMSIARIITEFNFKKAAGIIFISNHALSRNQKFEKKSIVIHHGVDRFFFKRKTTRVSFFSEKNPLRIVYPSSFFKYKNHNLILDSVNGLPDNIFIELTLVGDLKTANNRLVEKFENFNRPNINIKLINELNHFDLNKIYDYADVGLFASKCENLPNILLEMISKGLPVISSDYGSNIEVLGYNGFYFKKNDAKDLENKIITIYKSQRMRNQLSENNYVISQNYDWNETTKKTINYLKFITKSV